MPRFLLVVLLSSACASPFGQKVTVLLNDDIIDCVAPKKGGVATATIELDQPEDFYQAELVSADKSEGILLGARRVGTTVTFECPDGLDSLVVRHATVLQAKSGAPPPQSSTGVVPGP